MRYQTEYTKQNLIRMWDALLVGARKVYASFYVAILTELLGQFIGQVVLGMLCDVVGCSAALCASTSIILLGAILCVAARSISGSPLGVLWFLTIARGIIGVVRTSFPV